MDVSNFISITIAVVAMGAFAVQRYRDRRAEMGIVQELQKIKTTLEKGNRPPTPEYVESLISGVVERKRDETTQEEFEALRDMAIQAYAQARQKDKVIHEMLEDKASWAARLQEKELEIGRLTRKINSLLHDIEGFQRTIVKLSGAEDSGPIETGK